MEKTGQNAAKPARSPHLPPAKALVAKHFEAFLPDASVLNVDVLVVQREHDQVTLGAKPPELITTWIVILIAITLAFAFGPNAFGMPGAWPMAVNVTIAVGGLLIVAIIATVQLHLARRYHEVIGTPVVCDLAHRTLTLTMPNVTIPLESVRRLVLVSGRIETGPPSDIEQYSLHQLQVRFLDSDGHEQSIPAVTQFASGARLRRAIQCFKQETGISFEKRRGGALVCEEAKRLFSKLPWIVW